MRWGRKQAIAENRKKMICLVCWDSWPRPPAHSCLADSGGSAGTMRKAIFITLFGMIKGRREGCFLCHHSHVEGMFLDLTVPVKHNVIHDTREPTMVANPRSIARGSRRQHKLPCPRYYHLPIYCHANPAALSATLLPFPLSPFANPL